LSDYVSRIAVTKLESNNAHKEHMDDPANVT